MAKKLYSYGPTKGTTSKQPTNVTRQGGRVLNGFKSPTPKTRTLRPS